jgi:hypothetical protein
MSRVLVLFLAAAVVGGIPAGAAEPPKPAATEKTPADFLAKVDAEKGVQ